MVLLLNTRRRVQGHYTVAGGTLDSVLIHPREIFRLAIIAAASSVVLMHNHPSGEPLPSDSDVKVTRDLIVVGKLVKINVLDHIIVGHDCYCSLRAAGYFA